MVFPCGHAGRARGCSRPAGSPSPNSAARPKRNDVGDVLRAAAAPALLAAANDVGLIFRAALHVKQADAFRRMKLVRGKREENPRRVPSRPSSICRAPARRPCGTARLCCGRWRRFLRSEKSRRSRCSPTSRKRWRCRDGWLFQQMNVKRAVGFDGQEGDFVTALLELLAELDVGGVLDGGGDDVAFAGMGDERAVDRGVVALRAATGENDFPRIGVDQRGDFSRAASMSLATALPKV